MSITHMVKLRYDGRSYLVSLSKVLVESVLHWEPGAEITQEIEGDKIILKVEEKK